MEAKRWCIPIARTGLSIKRSKELLLLARNGSTGPVWRCPFIGVDRKWLAEGRNDAIRDTGLLRHVSDAGRLVALRCKHADGGVEDSTPLVVGRHGRTLLRVEGVSNRTD